jgi:hypothetical protein
MESTKSMRAAGTYLLYVDLIVSDKEKPYFHPVSKTEEKPQSSRSAWAEGR